MNSPRNMPSHPIVLCLGGHDPIGGAGIQADIETLTALGCHAGTAVTCLTVQDSRDARALHPVQATVFRAQAEAVLDDVQVDAIKIGLIGSPDLIGAIGDLLAAHPHIPVVFDPVLATGGGTDLAQTGLIDALVEQLLPLTDLITPNLAEARRLSGADTADDCAQALTDLGADAILLTGTDVIEDDAHVINRLYSANGLSRQWQWPRLPHSYHGSGCTLAAACAAHLALGSDLVEAVARAQHFTHDSLRRGWQPGHGQHLPWRRP